MILKLYVSRSFCQVEVWRPTGSIIVSCIVISHVDTIKVNFYLFFFQWNANKNSREISCRHGHQIFFIFWEKKKHFVEAIKKLNSIQLSKDVSWNPLWYILRQLRQKIESSIQQILCSLRQINFSTLNTKNPYLYTL